MSAQLKDIDPSATFGARKKRSIRPQGIGTPAEQTRLRQRDRVVIPLRDRRVTNSTMRDFYDGADLRAHVRPGALVAFSLPSLQGGRRVYPQRNPNKGKP